MPRSPIPFALLLLACGGSGDAPGSLDKDAARARDGLDDDGTDLCQRGGWYDDGVCDAFCPALDPVCVEEGVCDEGGWCWENPRPFGARTAAVWQFADGTVWASLVDGRLRVGQGEEDWSIVAGPGDVLSDLWASGKNDVWGAGTGGRIWHHDGQSWSVALEAPQEVNALWGTGPDDVWVVGRRGLILHRSFGAWSEHASWGCPNTLHDVHAAANDDVWVVGEVRTICHFDGSTWTSHGGDFEQQSQASISAVFAPPGGPTYAARSGGIYRFDGAAWQHQVWLPDDPASFTRYGVGGFAGSDAFDVWVAAGSQIGRYDGRDWTFTDSDVLVWQVASARFGEAWLGGHALLEAEPTELRPVDDAASFGRLQTSASASDGTLHAAGDDVIRRVDGVWQRVGARFAANGVISVWPAGDGTVWAGTAEQGLWRFDGSSWSQVAEVPRRSYVYALWGSGDQLWAGLSSGRVLHFDGAAWTEHQLAGYGDLRTLTGTGPDDVWAVGIGQLAHWDGQGWQETEGGGNFSHAAALAPGEVLLAGERPEIFVHRAGEPFEDARSIPLPEGDTVRSGSIASPSDVWFVPWAGDRLLHFDGERVSAETLPVGDVEGVHATDRALWIHGAAGTVLRRPR